MGKSYLEHLQSHHQFPQQDFDLVHNQLLFYGCSLLNLIRKYGSPLKMFYLPSVRSQIQKANNWFQEAIDKHKYQGSYTYCYCTKSNHYYPILKTALEAGAQLETSSELDIRLLEWLFDQGKITQQSTLLHNGYKSSSHLQAILNFQHKKFENSIIILDSKSELDRLTDILKNGSNPQKIGIRIAVHNNNPDENLTSRLGIAASDVLEFCKTQVQNHKSVKLDMIHYYMDQGMGDTPKYWAQLESMIQLYIELKLLCPSLNGFNIGGGLPYRNMLGFQFDYANLIDTIIQKIQSACLKAGVTQPNIYSEFGKYTVAESGANLYTIVDQKRQKTGQKWYLLDNSFMSTIPDAWISYEQFVMLPINNWEKDCEQVRLGGISCDHTDIYDSNKQTYQRSLPLIDSIQSDDRLYVAFFGTGAYQDALSSYGGIKHCLIPSPKVIFLDRDINGKLIESIHENLTSLDQQKEILGYNID